MSKAVQLTIDNAIATITLNRPEAMNSFNREMAEELENVLGGVYTVLSAEAQAPYARRILHILAKQKAAPKLPPSVTPVIVTGFSALGANSERVLITA